MKVLFIGNSHTYFNDMPYLFKQMADRMNNQNNEVTMLAYSGRTLKWHYEEYFAIRFALLYGNYDYCIIQQYAHPFPEEKETREYIEEIINLAKENNVRPVIYETWAAKDESNMTEVMSRLYHSLAEEYEVLLAPIGELFRKVSDEYPDIDLFYKDGQHASVYGDYLIASTFAMLLTGNRNIDLIDDKGIDFKVKIKTESKQPIAETDKEQIFVDLDSSKTAIIKKMVQQFVFKTE